ncbi:ribonuclease H-like domain-containing protein [Tanacetum coccineum]|uniref:Ribonuclease H-like domain-containing protein n=1 Tax=Tanacetum coccineum TaxID=301880 RepID=A0ABQ5H0E0_9ASTR
MINYALWEVLENGATLPKTKIVEGVMIEMPITTTEEKAQRRLEVKARSTLMMGITNEHQLKFNSIKDAKKLLEAVEKRFGGNTATRKTQKNLLKQQYKNFTAPSSEMLDQTFDRLQNLRNTSDLDTMSMDDLYNNLKVYEPEVKGMSSSSSSTQNMAFVSSSNNNTSSTNEAVNTAHDQPNSPQLVHEDLQQIHPDEMEEMDLRWQIGHVDYEGKKVFEEYKKKAYLQSSKKSRQQEQGKLKKECVTHKDSSLKHTIWRSGRIKEIASHIIKRERARSNVDHTRLISKSIFVTNFPDNTTSKDLWEVCKGYGTVVDVFIPDRKSKGGKVFAWFDRPPIHSSWPNISTRPAGNGASSFASVLKGNPNNFNHIDRSLAMRSFIDDGGFPAWRLAYFGWPSEADLWALSELNQNLSPNEKVNSSDPFNLYNLLNKRDKGEANSGLDSSIPFPPGFTPEREFQHVDAQEVQEHMFVSGQFVALYGSWVSNQAKSLGWSLYGMGDFNEVDAMEDFRLGSVYNAQGANEFNSFISNSGLVEIQLEGYSFTWSLQSAKKMSKLDRFFVSDGLLSLFPHLSGICLDRHLSDHRPIYFGKWSLWMVHQLTKFHVQRVDMVINPPWNLPFLGAKGLTSPEQTATVEMVFSQPWTCTFLVAKGLTTPELMANWKIIMLQFKNNSKDNAHKILKELIMKTLKET